MRIKIQPTDNVPLVNLIQLGKTIRAKRKEQGLTMAIVAQAAGISRVTLQRIEAGEPGVAIGAVASVLYSVGLSLQAGRPEKEQSPISVVRIDDFPVLRQLAWQMAPGTELTPIEAWGIYSRNARHVGEAEMQAPELTLVNQLRVRFGEF